jgi:hypothetical protein
VVTALTQEKIFQDKVFFAGWERTIANPARYALINSLRPDFRFDNVVNRITVRTMNYRHGVPLTHCHATPASIHCTQICVLENTRRGSAGASFFCDWLFTGRVARRNIALMENCLSGVDSMEVLVGFKSEMHPPTVYVNPTRGRSHLVYRRGSDTN